MSKSVRKFSTQFDRSKKVSLDTRFDSEGERYPLLTKPEFQAECDINNIVARFLKTGVLGDPARQALARYGDISQVPDFQEMNLRLNAAREAFMDLPARIREEYDHDPGKFIASLNSTESADLLIKHGLATKRAPTPSKEELEASKPITKGDIDKLAKAIKPPKKSVDSD